MRSLTPEQCQAFGAFIRQRREELGLVQSHVAREVGIARAYLCGIEKGALPPPSDTVLDLLAQVLQLPVPLIFVRACKLPQDIMRAFWQHPATEAILSTVPGMTLPNAQFFCQSYRAPLD